MLMIVLAAATHLQAPKTHGAELASAEQAAIAATVGDQLKDAQSAQYKWPPLSAAFLKNQSGSYCGWVNAKNSYGGYIGYRQFMVLAAVNIQNGRLETEGKADLDDGSVLEARIVTDGCSQDGYASEPPPSR